MDPLNGETHADYSERMQHVFTHHGVNTRSRRQELIRGAYNRTVIEDIKDGEKIKTFIRELRMNSGGPFCGVFFASDEYWTSLMQHASSYWLTIASAAGNRTGFALVSAPGKHCTTTVCVNKADTWYIELICSNGGAGTTILNHIKTHAKYQNIRYLTLSGLPRVVPYYLYNGFHIGGASGCVSSGNNQRLEDVINRLSATSRHSDHKYDKKFQEDTINEIVRLLKLHAMSCATGALLNKSKKASSDQFEDGIYMVYEQV